MGSKVLILAAALTVLALPVFGQNNTNSCTPTMIRSVGSCMSFLVNSTGNVSRPSSDCCNSLRSLTSGGMGCLCLIVTGGSAFRVPINRTLAISLPRACNMPGVPLQCQATAAPAPAPDVFSAGPTDPPAASPSPEASTGSEPAPSAQSPESDTPPLLTPPSVGEGAPTATGGSRPDLTPSSALHSQSLSLSTLLLAAVSGVAFMMINED